MDRENPAPRFCGIALNPLCVCRAPGAPTPYTLRVRLKLLPARLVLHQLRRVSMGSLRGGVCQGSVLTVAMRAGSLHRPAGGEQADCGGARGARRRCGHFDGRAGIGTRRRQQRDASSQGFYRRHRCRRGQGGCSRHWRRCHGVSPACPCFPVSRPPGDHHHLPPPSLAGAPVSMFLTRPRRPPFPVAPCTHTHDTPVRCSPGSR